MSEDTNAYLNHMEARGIWCQWGRFLTADSNGTLGTLCPCWDADVKRESLRRRNTVTQC